jgi:putative component of toxin-antitoxin plasmid stabilization module
MKPLWEFWAVRTARRNVLVDWLSRDKPLQAKVDVTLHRLQFMGPKWPMPYYRPLGGGVGEIRLDAGKVEHRIYGYFIGKSFVAMFGHSDKKTQQQAIKHAKALKKQFSKTPPPMERYDV